MEIEVLRKRVRFISVIGLVMALAGLALVVTGQSVLWGVVLLVPGLIMASTYRVATVIRLNYEMKQR
ncbi:MAG: hypothetical protein WCY65_03750 [Candidatus Methanomethylophilaceae archaeon]